MADTIEVADMGQRKGRFDPHRCKNGCGETTTNEHFCSPACMYQARIGQKRSPEAVEKTAGANRGRKHTAEARSRMGRPKQPWSDPRPRFWAKVDKNGPIPECRPDLGPCWEWTAATCKNGYGNFAGGDGHNYRAHRLTYEWLVGPIPDGLDLDHLCRHVNCVNPTHLEPVTRRENILRGETLPAANKAKTHCPRGHPLSGDNLYIDVKKGARHCRTCRAVALATYKQRKAA